MANIIGGIATSHTLTIGFAQDAGKHNDPVWPPIFKAFGPVKEWLQQKQPDVLLMARYNDQVLAPKKSGDRAAREIAQLVRQVALDAFRP